MIKGQDMVVLAVLMKSGAAQLVYGELAKEAHLSVSESHAAVKRLQEANLVNAEHRPIRRNVQEFLFHGLRYTFPLKCSGALARGMATSYAAPIAEGTFAVSGPGLVWECPEGTAYGRACEPLYSSAPLAAQNDPDIYASLALFDMLRGGRLRERQFAVNKLQERMPT